MGEAGGREQSKQGLMVYENDVGFHSKYNGEPLDGFKQGSVESEKI